MKSKFSSSKSLLGAALLIAVASATGAQAQSFTSTSATGLWNSNRWNNSMDAAPYTSAITVNNGANFTSGNYSFSGMTSSGTFNIGNVTVSSGVNVSFTAASGTVGGNGAVRTIDVGSNSTIDFNTQAFGTAAGNGWIKSGSGVLALAGGAYTAGFTLNAGTVIARGVDAFGAGTSSVLTLNGGTVASNATRSFSNVKYGGGIVIGGNVQFGELATVVSIASSTANLSFANNVGLGGATRTLTQGNNGTTTFSAIVSNTSGGITFAANANTDGRFDFTGTANTFTGDLNVNGGEVRFTADGSLGNAANDIIIDGGRFAKASDSTTVTLGAGRTISIGDGAGTAISSPGTGTLIYNGNIANKTAETGSWSKQGGGTLELGGASSYTGSTAINNGILKLTTGNDRLPTGTVVSLGQAASANVGTLDLNGSSQEIAGLNSTSGTNAAATNNTVTSATAATLTINGSGSYGDGTSANSGVITGLVSLDKKGAGILTLGDANTYTGATTVTSGTLAVTGSLASGSTVTVKTGATLAGTGGTIAGNTTVEGGGRLAVGNGTAGSIGTQTFTGTLALASTSVFDWDISSPTDNQVGDNQGSYDKVVNTNGTVLSGTSIFNVVLGSGKSFDNAFWDTNKSWTDVLTGTGLSGVDLATIFTSFTNNGAALTGGLIPGQGTFSFTGGTLNFAAVPEPSSALAGLLLGAGLLRRRRCQA